jgi:hypothetical protein
MEIPPLHKKGALPKAVRHKISFEYFGGLP